MDQVPLQISQIAGEILDWIGQQITGFGINPMSLLALLGIAALIYWACTGESV